MASIFIQSSTDEVLKLLERIKSKIDLFVIAEAIYYIQQQIQIILILTQ